jgi:hypothetical protein
MRRSGATARRSATITNCVWSAIEQRPALGPEGLAELTEQVVGRHMTIGSGPIDKPGNSAMSDDDLKAELERLRNENAALKKGASTSIRMKVSEKGALSIYGMGRFPVTLYKEQWLKLLDMSADIRAFIAANESKLKAKE